MTDRFPNWKPTAAHPYPFPPIAGGDGTDAPPAEPEAEAQAERLAALAKGISAQILPQVDERIEKKVAEAIDKDDFPESIAAKIRANLDIAELTRPIVETQVAEVLEAGNVPDAFKRAFAGAPPDATDPAGPIGSYLLDPTKPNPHAVGAPLNGKFESWGDFLRSVAKAGRNQGVDKRLAWVADDGLIRADMSGESLATGGALVPEEFRAALLEISMQSAQIRSRAFNIPMSVPRIRLPALADSDHSANLWGGVVGNWTAPGGTITETEPVFEKVQLDANGLKLYTEVENELLADSFISFEALLIRMFGGANTFFEEKEFVGGDGSAKPKGFRNADSKVSVTRAGANLVAIADLAGMMGRLLPASFGGAVWMCAPAVIPQLLQIESTAGAQALIRDIGSEIVTTIYGRPVVVNEHMPTLGAADDIMLVDLSFYLIGDRQAQSIASSPHVKFQNDLTAFRGVSRVAGMPWVTTAITPANGGDTLSPFVSLAA